MNTTITTLLENKKILEERILNLQNELITTNKSLTQELYKETVLYDSVLKNSVVDILKMFEKNGLWCDKITNGSPGTQRYISFAITDGNYFVDIKPENGTIIMEKKIVLNDGGGKELYTLVQKIIDKNLIPYCEKHKNEHVKETEWY